MSTTTNFKRIALVAVAALGMGVLSSVPANAAIGTSTTVTVVAGTATTATSDSSTAATARVVFLQTAGQTDQADSMTVTAVVKSVPTGATAPAVTLFLVDTGTAGLSSVVDTNTSRAVDGASRPSGTNSSAAVSGGFSNLPDALSTTRTFIQYAADTSVAASYSSANYGVFLETTGVTLVAGTYTISIITTPYDNSSAVLKGGQINTTNQKITDVNIVVSAVASAALPAVATGSTAIMNSGSSYVATALDSSVVALSTASTTAVANIRVILKNAAGTTAARESVTVTTTLGTVGSSGAFGRSVTLEYNSSSGLDIGVRPDGSAGVATISISTPSVTFAAKTVTFYGAKPATLVASVATPNLKLGSQDDVIRVIAKDAAGVNWAGSLYSYASTAADGLIAALQLFLYFVLGMLPWQTRVSGYW